MHIQLTKYKIYLSKGALPLTPPKIIYMSTYKFWKKGGWKTQIFSSPNTFFLAKGVVPLTLQPSKIVYILLIKYKIFLGKGALPPAILTKGQLSGLN